MQMHSSDRWLKVLGLEMLIIYISVPRGILEKGLLPLLATKFPAGTTQQDNDPKHTSKFTEAFFVSHEINWWKTPPESPDINPIENVWGSMKTYLRQKYKPTNLEDLKLGIKSFWSNLPAV